MRRLARFLSESRGASAVEFALLCPVLVLMLMGLMDLGYQAYARAVLEGEMQRAGRESGIEGVVTTSVDARVTAAFQNIARNATLRFSRKNYSDFSTMKPERFTDSNNNGVRDPGECYDDVNGNKRWDADPGKQGLGGASEVVKYTAEATFQRLFPLGNLIGWSNEITISSTTMLKSQPYSSQNIAPVLVRCD